MSMLHRLVTYIMIQDALDIIATATETLTVSSRDITGIHPQIFKEVDIE